jgi:tRNA(Ile)-lysidine synthetase-like protein
LRFGARAAARAAIVSAGLTAADTLPHLRVRAVHVNHGIHPNAAKWAVHCRALGRRFGVPVRVLTTHVTRTPGVSLEAAARDARYALLADELEAGECLLTGHHEDDQLETVLLQLFRGAGLAGLAAMPAIAPFAGGSLARPLLSRSRVELEEWARSQALSWIDDDTNSDESLDRNYLRRQVLPLIHERWKGVGSAVSRSARHAAEGQRLLDALGRADVERASSGAALFVPALRALQPDRRRNALRFWIMQSGARVPDTSRLEEIAGPLIDARPDANPSVTWGNVTASRHADLLTITNVSPTRTGRRRGDRRQYAVDSGEVDASRLGRDSPRRARVEGGRGGQQRHVGGTRGGVDASRHSRNSPRRIQAARPRASRSNAGASSASRAADSARLPGDESAATGAASVEWPWTTTPRLPLADGGTLELKADPHGPIDLDVLPERVTVSRRRGGERLRPRRGGPRRTLKSLLQESHLPIVQRRLLPLVFSGVTLLAVGSLWVDESIQVTTRTRRRARLIHVLPAS